MGIFTVLEREAPKNSIHIVQSLCPFTICKCYWDLIMCVDIQQIDFVEDPKNVTVSEGDTQKLFKKLLWPILPHPADASHHKIRNDLIIYSKCVWQPILYYIVSWLLVRPPFTSKNRNKIDSHWNSVHPFHVALGTDETQKNDH